MVAEIVIFSGFYKIETFFSDLFFNLIFFFPDETHDLKYDRCLHMLSLHIHKYYKLCTWPLG